MTQEHRRTVSLFALVVLAASLALAALVQAAVVAPKTTELGRGPTIVIVHALGAARNDWLPTARKLLGRYRIVLVELPGHGESPLPEPFTFAAVGEALDAVISKQNPDSTIVVGHQFGGRAALAALAAHPGHARGLLLLDVPVGVPLQIQDQQKRQFLDAMDRSYEGIARSMFGKLGRDSLQNGPILTVFMQTAPATVKAFVREGFFSDGNKDSKALKLPVRMVATSRMWKPEMSSGAVLKQLGWDDTTATVLRLPESGYWAMKDQPDSLAELISQFATASFAAAKK